MYRSGTDTCRWQQSVSRTVIMATIMTDAMSAGPTGQNAEGDEQAARTSARRGRRREACRVGTRVREERAGLVESIAAEPAEQLLRPAQPSEAEDDSREEKAIAQVSTPSYC
jgi:hypothetical protein